MRKFAAIFISMIYLLLSTGIVIDMHYCHGELESVSIVGNSSKCCCYDEESENGCCSNEKHIIQLDIDDQLIASNLELSNPYYYFEYAYSIEENKLPETIEKHKLSYSDKSPPIPKPAIWKTNCSFLFYG